MSPLIQVNNLYVKRGRSTILEDISFDIQENSFTTIIGPNGAGKSMLLKCLMNFYKADSGIIERKKNLKIGYVPQRLVTDLSMPITVERFIRLRQKISQQEFEAVIQQTNLAPLLDKMISVLSGGEMQRVLLTRALLQSPELLILDEPAQNLDLSGQIAFYSLIDKIYNDHKISILMVSHDLHMVMAKTKNVICLFKHICCSGTPQSVTQDPAFKNLFGGDMTQLMALYQHNHDHRVCPH